MTVKLVFEVGFYVNLTHDSKRVKSKINIFTSQCYCENSFYKQSESANWIVPTTMICDNSLHSALYHFHHFYTKIDVVICKQASEQNGKLRIMEKVFVKERVCVCVRERVKELNINAGCCFYLLSLVFFPSLCVLPCGIFADCVAQTFMRYILIICYWVHLMPFSLTDAWMHTEQRRSLGWQNVNT